MYTCPLSRKAVKIWTTEDLSKSLGAFNQVEKARGFAYLVHCEGNFDWSILINFCHDIIDILCHPVSIDTIVLWPTPKLVLIYTLLDTSRSRIWRFTTRVGTTSIVKIWITLQGLRWLFTAFINSKRTQFKSHMLRQEQENTTWRALSYTWSVILQVDSFYLLSNNSMANKVSPCRNWVTTITAVTTHEAAACQKIINRQRNVLKQILYLITKKYENKIWVITH